MIKPMKLTIPAVKKRSELDLLVREIAGLKLNEKLLTATMDAEIQSVRDEYSAKLERVREQLEMKTAAARDWAVNHPAAFGKRKSIDLTHAVIGFRTGPPKLRIASKTRWDRMLETLRETRWGAAYIRVKEEVNKEQIIADVTAQVLDAGDLEKVGASVVQEESFYVEPKFSQIEPREVATAVVAR